MVGASFRVLLYDSDCMIEFFKTVQILQPARHKRARSRSPDS